MFNKNIVLIGMPGSGKTTIGKKLSDIIRIPFVDMDNYIENNFNVNISTIISKSENAFRDLETKAAINLSKSYPTVISTGGGIVKRSNNIKILKTNGIIFFLNRDINDIREDIDIESRPLLKDGIHKLFQLYNERYHLYKKYCDIEINCNNIDDTIKKILGVLDDMSKT